ncbi:MAG: cytochrome c3 family protein [Candidatus Binataceae bacterium]
MKAQVGQPSGASRLCLSCHDGILAMSKLRVMPQGMLSSLGPLTGKASLGTDLSRDHPVSFIYNSALALSKEDLVDPVALPPTAPLEDGQMQCSSCHDPHEDRIANFLRIDPRSGAACTVCHRPHYWRDSSHATSPETWHGGAEEPWPKDGFATVGENACLSCHRVHGAAHAEHLLAQDIEENNCTICHNGMLARANIQQEFFKPSRHPVESRQWTHDEAEDPLSMPRHVTCVDCHNPHAAKASAKSESFGSSSQATMVPGAIREVSGVTMGGVGAKVAAFEYEICFKCHGLAEPTTRGILRCEVTRNIRLKVNPNNPSYHPIAAPGRNPRVLGLTPPYTLSSLLSCTDCHNNDQWTPGESAPRGPHGSRFEPILQMEYETVDPSPESYSSYALCYKCHNRSSVLFSFGGFPHKQHVVDQRSSCAVCHDAHGSRRNPYLINFMTVTELGNTVVRPSRSGRLEFDPGPGSGHGRCYLNCHGAEHNPRAY